MKCKILPQTALIPSYNNNNDNYTNTDTTTTTTTTNNNNNKLYFMRVKSTLHIETVEPMAYTVMN